MLTLFAWPLAKLGPRDLPIGVGGAPAAAGAIEQKLAAQDGAFDIHRYADEAAAREAIADREVYGAFVATPGGAKMLIAIGRQPGGRADAHARGERDRNAGAGRGRRVRRARPAARWRRPCCRS